MTLAEILSHFGCGDGQGNVSSVRLGMLMTFIVVLGAYAYAAIHTGTMPEVPASNLELLGVAAGLKAVQNSQEKDPQPKPAQS